MTTKRATRLEKAKKMAKQFNDTLIQTSEAAIEETVKTGGKWQKVMSHAIKETESLGESQMDMILDTAEAIKGQVDHSTKRLKNLVGIDTATDKKGKKAASTNPVSKKVKEMVEEVVENPIIQSARKTSNELKKELVNKIDEVKEVVENLSEIKRKPSQKDDLKVIRGIGPKMEEILNQKGIKTFEDITKTSLKDIRAILNEAGPIFSIQNPKDWKKQAQIAATGNMDKLAEWIKKNK